MKYPIMLLLTLSSFVVYGQNVDLIVTTTGDSLKCKIIDVGNAEIQFRFGEGQLISIKRSETASYHYNFAPMSETEVKNKDIEKRNIEQKDNTQKSDNFSSYYAGLVAGYGFEGEGPFIGLNAGYFFGKSLGYGIVALQQYNDYYEKITFLGPVFCGKFGNKKTFFPVNIGIGGLWEYDNSDPLFAVYASIGMAHRLSDLISIGLNVERACDPGDYLWGMGGASINIKFHF
jgi:hypothetical protein